MVIRAWRMWANSTKIAASVSLGRISPPHWPVSSLTFAALDLYLTSISLVQLSRSAAGHFACQLWKAGASHGQWHTSAASLPHLRAACPCPLSTPNLDSAVGPSHGKAWAHILSWWRSGARVLDPNSTRQRVGFLRSSLKTVVLHGFVCLLLPLPLRNLILPSRFVTCPGACVSFGASSIERLWLLLQSQLLRRRLSKQAGPIVRLDSNKHVLLDTGHSPRGCFVFRLGDAHIHQERHRLVIRLVGAGIRLLPGRWRGGVSGCHNKPKRSILGHLQHAKRSDAYL